MSLLPCPLGFALDVDSGKCTCAKAFLRLMRDENLFIICNITRQTITQSYFGNVNTWAGAMSFQNKSDFGVSLSCPHSYCVNNIYDTFLSQNNSLYVIDMVGRVELLCLYHRKGTLCGECTEHLSVMFGSYRCMYCSNGWSWTVVVYLALGPLFVYLLYALKLTLNVGTLTGVIFFTQATMLLLEEFKLGSSRDIYIMIPVVYFSMLNLGIGFPVCLYNGMTELKAGLSLLFPVYLLIILVVLVIVSFYSTYISNRISQSFVQVLVTVIHLSFSKLLLALINIIPVTVYTSEGKQRVWYWDGNVVYGDASYNALIAVTVSVVIPLLLPYIAVLVFAKPLRHFSFYQKYLRPLVEAIHAPYKEGREHWFTVRLLVLVIIYVLHAAFQSKYGSFSYVTFSVILLVLGLLAQAALRPFKNKALNILDFWVTCNTTIVYILAWFYIILVDNDWITVAVMIVAYMMIATSLVILFYHILWVTGYLEKMMIHFKILQTMLKSLQISVIKQNTKVSASCSVTHGSYGSCVSCREPLLEELC